MTRASGVGFVVTYIVIALAVIEPQRTTFHTVLLLATIAAWGYIGWRR